MIELVQGNLLKADAEALVNTVNCVGFMGKGIALQFKKAYPDNFGVYQKACNAGEVKPGKVLTVETGQLFNPKYIINFPTKRHWKNNSRLEDIRAGLVDLVQAVKDLGIESIAIPPLGCGLGGLKWDEVRPLIEAAFEELPDVKVLLFSPAGPPKHHDRVNRTEKPALTRARSQYIGLMARYSILNYNLSLLEMQKLAYFLQEAGEPLRLQYQKHFYGPYADNLNHVLNVLEGHFLEGYDGERSPIKEIHLKPGAAEAAEQFLESEPAEVKERMERISELIAGYETPYGMELLASIHWLVHYEEPALRDLEAVTKAIEVWTPRKRRTFQKLHIQKAWEHLQKLGWIPEVV